MFRRFNSTYKILTALIIFSLVANPLFACTGIRLIAKDGSVIFARTMEWGTFDLNSRLVIVPRGQEYQSQLGDNQTGLEWTARFGAVGLDALGKNMLVDGMNEKGLSVNLFYHPGFAEYPQPDLNNLDKTISVIDVCQYLLTTCESLAEVKAHVSGATIVGVVEPAIGIAPPVHFMVTAPSGKSLVIEFSNKSVQFHEATLGCITNAPTYDWHLTNLRNYLNLSPVALPMKKIENLDLAPLGGGSGMIGLPGDFTPPSRFVRAVAASQTARPTDTGLETMYEAFRILDNFNLPLGAAEGEGDATTEGMRSSTIWTTAYDTNNLVMHYHTMHNRRVRQVDLKTIDFAKLKELVHIPLDRTKAQDIDHVVIPQ